MGSESAITRPVLSRVEAADYLGIHIHTLDRSDIPRIRIGARILFRRSTLDDLLAKEEQRDGRRRECGK